MFERGQIRRGMMERVAKTGALFLSALFLILLQLAGCGSSPSPLSSSATRPNSQSEDAESAPGRGLERIPSEHLPNAIQIHERVISGGLPEDDDAFSELADLGVKTIVSVDGMTPDVATARKYGLQYVHLPHGYDGIPQHRVEELAKAVLELDGPIYIHCHHGKHRSPAAATVACVAAGLIPQSQAVAVLEFAGASSGYQGIYRAAQDAKVMDESLLRALQVEFKEVQEIPPMAEAMVQLSHAWEHLQRIADSDWRAPADHPDLDPAHEALLLRELYTELLRADNSVGDATDRGSDFRAWLESSESAAQELEMQLRRWHGDGAIGRAPARITELMGEISADCKACHVKYRDVPLQE